MMGLLTPFGVHNYGTKLQAFAVQTYLSRYDDTEVINYRPSLLEKIVRKPTNILLSRFRDTNAESMGCQPNEKKRIEARYAALDSFDTLLRTSNTIVGRRALGRHAANYTAVICGSDQIWNPVNLASRIYMLECVPRQVRKVAFSPSFGVESIPRYLKHTYKRRIKHLDYLSSRELSGVSILRSLGFEQACWTLDPTLMLKWCEWKQLAEEPAEPRLSHERYLLCYFLGSRKVERDVARRVANTHDLKIVSFPHFKTHVVYDDDFADIPIYVANVQNFIWLVSHANAVCTDSFHCTVFSILSGRNFYYIPRHGAESKYATNARVISFLNSLRLAERVVGSRSEADCVLSSSIDYERVWRLLDDRRAQTACYLDEALGDIR